LFRVFPTNFTHSFWQNKKKPEQNHSQKLEFHTLSSAGVLPLARLKRARNVADFGDAAALVPTKFQGIGNFHECQNQQEFHTRQGQG